LGIIADLFISCENSCADGHSTNATDERGLRRFSSFNQSLYGAVLARVIRHFIALNANAVAALAIPGSPLAHLLERAGFRFSRGIFDVRAVPFNAQWPSQRLRQPEAWFLTGSEFDVV
jgi:hypothetical protein